MVKRIRWYCIILNFSTVVYINDDQCYQLENNKGTLLRMYSRNQFIVCSEHVSEVLTTERSAREIANVHFSGRVLKNVFAKLNACQMLTQIWVNIKGNLGEHIDNKRTSIIKICSRSWNFRIYTDCYILLYRWHINGVNCIIKCKISFGYREWAIWEWTNRE